jgi:dihydrofolate reductase
MAQLIVDISMSLDGFVAGPNQTLEQPLGEGGERVHEWAIGLASWRSEHGLTGGATGADDEIVQESVARTPATVMGRRMFSGGEGPWEDDPNRDGWYGEELPFQFDALEKKGPRGLEVTRVIASPAVTHLRYGVVK